NIAWVGLVQVSVVAPLCLFYGTGTFYRGVKKEYLVQGFLLNIRFDYAKNEVDLCCYYPMSFFKSAKIEIGGIKLPDTEISYEIRYEPFTAAANTSSYFHATYKDVPKPVLGKDMTFLDTRG